MNLTIDLTYLNELCDNDSSFIVDILETFLIEVPKDIQQLKTYIQAENIVHTGLLIHKTKASLKLLGVQELLTFAVKAEQLAKIDSENVFILELGATFCNYLNDLVSNTTLKLEEYKVID
jgi:HPt (histidine-containing phosphotransfer) domain-containing protein